MTNDELRSQAIAEHEDVVNGWIEEKKQAIKASLLSQRTNHQESLRRLEEEIAAFFPDVDAMPEGPEQTEPQG